MSTIPATHQPVERAVIVSVLLAVGAIVSYAIVIEPWLMAGASIAVALLVLISTRPLLLLALLLAVGPTDLSALTGGFKNLFVGLGGLDANGIRLIAVSAGFAMLALISPHVRAAAFGKYGRVYLVFLIYIGFTLAYSMSPIDGARLYLKLAYPFFIFIGTLGLARTRADLERLLGIALISVGLIAVVITPITIMMGRYTYEAGYIRIHGVIGFSPFSFYLLMAMLMSLSRFIVRRQWIYLALAFLLGFWMVMTHTRITLAAAMASLLVITVLEASRRGWRALLGGVLVGLLIGLPLVPAVLERSLGFVPTPGQLLHLMTDPMALYNSINWQGRQVLWPIVFAQFLASPIVGLGLGSSTAITRANFPDWAGQVVHNEYLRLATETGAIGVALFAVAIMIWLYGCFKAWQSGDRLATEFALAGIGGIVAWTFISITDNPFDYYAPFTQFIGFAVAGSIAAASFAQKEKG
jgi:O-antigen ligase